MPPELLGQNMCDMTSDLWSLGCILYFLCYGRGPFFAHCELDLYNQIIRGEVEFPEVGLVLDRAKM
jgi:serine/threonine protein kinase